MTKVLMIGSFLSKRYGTISVSEKLTLQLNEPNLSLRLVSFRHAKLIRFLDIVIACLFGSYDKLHIDTFSGQSFRIAEIASLIGKWRKKPIILTLRGGKLPEFSVNSFDQIKTVFGRSWYIQTPSLYLKESFEKHGIVVHYLPNAIEPKRFPYSRLEVSKHSILWVRAFNEIYNPDIPVKVLFEVKKNFPDSTLTMVGPDKGLLSEVIRLVHELNLDSSVTITGPVPNEELYTYYQSHEVFLNTTSYESFGVAVLEAASCGIPVVSGRIGEIPYLYKHNENILITDDLVPIAFAKETMLLFENPELSASISKNARELAEKYNWEIIRERWVRLFNDLNCH